MAPPVAPRISCFNSDILHEATGGFAEENCFARFQFGKLYRVVGRFSSSHLIVKVYEKEVHGYEIRPWDSEARMVDEDCLANDTYVISHPNIVKFEGMSFLAERPAFIYELEALDTVHNLIDKDSFSWPQRVKVAYGFASVVAHMHACKPIPYIIRNLSAAHILLDKEYNPKLYDFSMISGGNLTDKRDILNQYVHGCHGYIDPDYFSNGKWSEKCDVFAYGVILISLLSKKVVVEIDKKRNPEPCLYEWAYNKYQEKKCEQKFEGGPFSLVHQSLKSEVIFSTEDGVALTKLAMHCVAKNPLKRPTMKQVVGRLQKLSIIKKYDDHHGFEKEINTSDFKFSEIQKLLPKILKSGLKVERNMLTTLAKRLTGMLDSSKAENELYIRAPIILTHEDLKRFTDDFSEENYIDIHQFGKLYHGKMMSQEVTVKTWEDIGFFKVRERDNEIRLRDELALLQHPTFIAHPHIVKIIGYCLEDGRLGAVYDLKSLDTLEKLVENDSFTWRQRIKFSVKLAGLLKFLQTSIPPYEPYVLRNLVPNNILVDKDCNPKLFNFGMLSGGILNDKEHTRPRNCHRWLYYIDPHTDCFDYYMKFSDIYSFGMVLLNLISKKLEIAEEDYYERWVYNEYEQAASKGSWSLKHFSLADKSFAFESDFEVTHAEKLTKLVMQCISRDWKERPTIDVVVKQLENLTHW